MSMTLKLVDYGTEILSTNLETFDFNNPPEDPVKIKEIMLHNLVEHNGLGLASNQIGLPYRVFALNTEPKMVCFNPSITYFSEDYSVIEEGCLTHPMLYVKIRRPNLVRVKFADEKNVLHTHKLDGIIGRAFQHELDHLNGIDYLSRASNYHLNQAKRKAKLLTRKKKKFMKQQGVYYGN